MASGITTYCQVPEYSIDRTVTSADLLRACTLLGQAFTSEFGGEYIFEPERISGGGVQWMSWPGKTLEQYKTMRLRFHKYPWVDELL